MSKHVREKCGILCISSILRSKWGITPTKIDINWLQSNLICGTVKESHAQFQHKISKHVREKCRKLCFFSVLRSKRGITPTKIDANWLHSNLICSTVKQSHMKVSAQYVKACKSEKCGILCISSILRSKWGISTTKTDVNWRHSNLIWSTVKQSHMQTFSSICPSL